MKIHEEVYDGHLIRANDSAAMIFLDGSKNLEHKFRSTSLEDALEKAHGWIDRKNATRKADRREANIGTVDGYTEALSLIKLNKSKKLMLVAHRRADNLRMTQVQLAEAAGWKSHSSVATHYATLGKTVAEQLNLKVDGDNKEAWTSTLAILDSETGEWEMHAEVAEAMDRLNIG